jgi:1-deoxy-D-xylulose-5-phosphate synthase
VLEKIDGPKDLKLLSLEDLKCLCQEIRELIVKTVLENGGHLAAPLGAVELIVALHRAFSSPKDAIVFDVGHQAYAHKILTGRRGMFPTLRRHGGLAPFPTREESIHDAFGVGHAGTAISASLGILAAKKRIGQEGRVIAVLGDGGLTAGMSFEALNQEEALKQGLIIVLNDNAMSISKNVGALASFLSKALVSRPLLRIESELKGILKKNIPFGEPLYYLGKGIKEGLASGYLDVGLFFQSLGFQYVGPLDGHDLSELAWAFERTKELRKPVLVHVRTKKGKGFAPSESDPCAYHGVGIKPKEKPSSNAPRWSYSKVFGQAMIRLAEQDERVLAVTAAMPDGTGLREFFTRFPERAFDVGICEQHAVTFAAGLATQGLKPVVAIYSTFLQRAYDQVIHDVCLQNLPVTFVMDRAGIVGEDGPTHHGTFDIAYLRPIPNVVLAAPKDFREFVLLLNTAVSSGRPFFIRIPKATAVYSPNGAFVKEETLQVGSWEVLTKGEDLALLGTGRTIETLLCLAQRLRAKGFAPIVVNARFLKPFDDECLKWLSTLANAWVSLEDGVKIGGLGSLLAEYLADSGKRSVRLLRLGIEDAFVPHGEFESLEKDYGMDGASLEGRVLGWLERGEWAEA